MHNKNWKCKTEFGICNNEIKYARKLSGFIMRNKNSQKEIKFTIEKLGYTIRNWN